MRSELKHVRCGCGGEAIIGLKEWEDRKGNYHENSFVYCNDCSISTGGYLTEAEAVTAWNRAMSGSAEEKLKSFWDGMSAEMREERTAMVIEHDASISTTDGYKYHRTEYLCGSCHKKVIGGDDYCSHCGAKLDWSNDE